MELFDTHAHLDDEQLVADFEGVMSRAANAGIRHVIAVGTTGPSSAECVKLAGRSPAVYAAVGVQPNYGSQMAANDWQIVTELACHPRVVAIGETGLDAYWDYTPWQDQVLLFERHIELSRKTGKPFIVHMRDCGEPMVDFLKNAAGGSPLRGVMHSFTGEIDLAQQCLELGLYISFAGMVTFKKSQQLRDVAREIPSDRLLIETDSPYLSPHPHRGKRPNEPAMLRHTAECLADVRGVSMDELAACTTANACQLFGLPVS
jgi:TatD DNase family protein